MIDPIVDEQWLRTHRDDVIVVDCRCYLDGRSTRQAYDDGHFPGAVYVDLDRHLAAPATPEAGRHPLPDPDVFAAGMSEAGIADGSTVVAYDDEGGVMAARLVWMLRALGQSAGLLIDVRPQDFTAEPVIITPGRFTPRPWPVAKLATLDQTATAAAAGGPVIDARPPERFLGETEPMDPRAGHIPGARNVSCRAHLRDGRLAGVDSLRETFRRAGLTPNGGFISYCGSGVTACHNLLVAEHAGFAGGRLFPGSWSQYSADEARPVATGRA